MKTAEYINRYKDKYTFTPTDDGNVLWEGSFVFCRVGYPNDYTKAYEAYRNDGGDIMVMDEFKKKIHEYDGDKKEYVMKKYLVLVESLKDKIDMVDPSGGPYLSVGMSSELVHPEIKGKEIYGFESVKGGYKIILR